MAASYAVAKEDLLQRLRKIEGQIKGLQRMVEEEKYCVDVLVQIAAVRAAINSVGTMIFEYHTRGCVRNALESNNEEADEKIEELVDVLRRFMK